MSAYTEGIICVLCINAIAVMGVSDYRLHGDF